MKKILCSLITILCLVGCSSLPKNTSENIVGNKNYTEKNVTTLLDNKTKSIYGNNAKVVYEFQVQKAGTDYLAIDYSKVASNKINALVTVGAKSTNWLQTTYKVAINKNLTQTEAAGLKDQFTELGRELKKEEENELLKNINAKNELNENISAINMENERKQKAMMIVNQKETSDLLRAASAAPTDEEIANAKLKLDNAKVERDLKVQSIKNDSQIQSIKNDRENNALDF